MEESPNDPLPAAHAPAEACQRRCTNDVCSQSPALVGAKIRRGWVCVERGDQEGTVSPNWLSTLELWRHLYTGKEKSFVRKDLPTNFKSYFQGFACNDEETF